MERQQEILQDRPGRQIGQTDIDALWAMSEAFTDTDQRLGGGYARSTLIHYTLILVDQAARDRSMLNPLMAEVGKGMPVR